MKNLIFIFLVFSIGCNKQYLESGIQGQWRKPNGSEFSLEFTDLNKGSGWITADVLHLSLATGKSDIRKDTFPCVAYRQSDLFDIDFYFQGEKKSWTFHVLKYGENKLKVKDIGHHEEYFLTKIND